MSSELTTSTEGSVWPVPRVGRSRWTAGAFAFAGDDDLAGVAPVAGDIQSGSGIHCNRTQPGGLGSSSGHACSEIAIFSLPAMWRAIAAISAGV